MKPHFAALLILLAGCGEDICRGSDAKYWNDALAFNLAKRKVDYRVSGEVICVAAGKSAEMREALAEVDASFHLIAHLLKDSCEERAFAEWAKKQGLRFDIRPTLNERNEPSGPKMFLVRSFTREEALANQVKFDMTAPKKATCAN